MRPFPFPSQSLSNFLTSLKSADWPRVAVTLAIGTAGALAFSAFGLPAAFLSGAMVFVAIAAMVRIPTEIPHALRDLCFFATGIAMGSGVSPQAAAGAGQWPLSLAILSVAVLAIGASVYLFFTRIAGWDRKTAFYASIPGALTFVMALASKSEADIRFVAISQSIRVFFLIALLPIVLIGSNDALPPTGPLAAMIGLRDAALLLFTAVVVVTVLTRFRVPAAAMVGPFVASAGLYGAGFVSGAIHPAILGAGLIVLGGVIGNRFGSIDLATLRRLVLVSAGALLIGLAIAVGFAGLAVWATGLPFAQVLLAFAPGGLEAMVILSFLFDLDPAYVAAHQVGRIVGMMIFLPMIVRFLGPNSTDG